MLTLIHLYIFIDFYVLLSYRVQTLRCRFKNPVTRDSEWKYFKIVIYCVIMYVYMPPNAYYLKQK